MRLEHSFLWVIVWGFILLSCNERVSEVPDNVDYPHEYADYLSWLQTLPIPDDVRWMIRENKHCVAQHVLSDKVVVEIHSNKRYVYHLVITEITSNGLAYHYLYLDDLLQHTTSIYDSMGYDMAFYPKLSAGVFRNKEVPGQADTSFFDEDCPRVEALLNEMHCFDFESHSDADLQSNYWTPERENILQDLLAICYELTTTASNRAEGISYYEASCQIQYNLYYVNEGVVISLKCGCYDRRLPLWHRFNYNYEEDAVLY